MTKPIIRLFILPFFAIALFASDIAYAQAIEITPYGGYMWGGRFKGFNGEVDFGDHGNFGIAASTEVRPGSFVEFTWFQMESKDSYVRYYGESHRNRSLNILNNYFQLGMIQEVGYSEDFRPFGLISFGASHHTPDNDSKYEDEWFFAMTLGGGVKYFFNENVGIRVQGRFMFPMYFGGGGLWCGTGSGCSVGASTYSAFVQGDVSGGLILRLYR
jgi:opacity protein-like surface antigen